MSTRSPSRRQWLRRVHRLVPMMGLALFAAIVWPLQAAEPAPGPDRAPPDREKVDSRRQPPGPEKKAKKAPGREHKPVAAAPERDARGPEDQTLPPPPPRDRGSRDEQFGPPQRGPRMGPGHFAQRGPEFDDQRDDRGPRDGRMMPPPPFRDREARGQQFGPPRGGPRMGPGHFAQRGPEFDDPRDDRGPGEGRMMPPPPFRDREARDEQFGPPRGGPRMGPGHFAQRGPEFDDPRDDRGPGEGRMMPPPPFRDRDARGEEFGPPRGGPRMGPGHLAQRGSEFDERRDDRGPGEGRRMPPPPFRDREGRGEQFGPPRGGPQAGPAGQPPCSKGDGPRDGHKSKRRPLAPEPPMDRQGE